MCIPTHGRAGKTHTPPKRAHLWGVHVFSSKQKLLQVNNPVSASFWHRGKISLKVRVHRPHGDGERGFYSAVKTGKALWWVSLISVWLQPSWLPALLASLASAGWLLCPHLALPAHTQTSPNVNFARWFSYQVFIPLSHVDMFMHHLKHGSCFLSAAHRVYTSCLSYPSDFSFP